VSNGPLPDAYVERIQRYMEKALREAKLHTSWINPWDDYEHAVREFITGILEPRGDNVFLADMRAWIERTLRPGLWSCLSALLLKVTIPGVPDFYQGTELWDDRLVDPDNRQPVDIDCRQALLREVDEIAQRDGPAALEALAARPEDPRLKLWVTSRALRYRRRMAALFARGGYDNIVAEGSRADHVVAFARRSGKRHVVVAVARWYARLMAHGAPPLGRDVWGDTSLAVPARF